MGTQLSLLYDKEGDVLYIEAVRPYAEQVSDEIADGVIARMNPASGDVECLEILSFSRRFKDLDELLVLPLSAQLNLLSA